MKTIFLNFLILSVFLPSFICAQNTFFKRYSDISTNLLGYSVLYTSDGGLLIGEGPGLEDLDEPFQLMKLNSLGDSVWTLSLPYPDTSYMSFLKTKETYDKNLILIGTKWDMNEDTGYSVLTKFSSWNTILWTTNIYNSDWGMDIACSKDSGYVIAGSYNLQMHIIKVDSIGNQIWETMVPFSQYYGNTALEELPYSIHNTMDGGYIVCGAGTYSTYNAYKVVKLDSSGGIQWEKLFYSEHWDDILIGTLSVSEDPLGNFFLFSTEGYFYDPLYMYCLKLDSNGDSLWANYYKGYGESILGGGMVTSDGGAILTGTTAIGSIGDNGSTTMYICKINTNGSIDWENYLDVQSKIGTNEQIYTLGLDSIPNDGFAITGWIYDKTTYATDVCLIKTNQYGNVLLNSNNVWPGDANSDLVANNIDLLNVGVAYGSTGTSRTSVSNNWSAQASTDWGTTFTNGIDYKNADCNGDGTINDDDTLAIYLNYGLTHNKTSLQNNAQATDPNLYLELLNDTANTSDTLKIAIKLGTASIPANDVYGLAFSINYNSAMIDSGSAKVYFTNSWLGDNSNSLSLVKDLYSNGRIDIAITRKDQQNISGYGDIGELEVIIEDNIAGKDTIYKLIDFTISDVKVISNNESEIAVNIGNDSITIQGFAGILEEVIQDKVKLYPNPANNFLTLELPKNEAYTISIFNSIGLMVYSNMHTSQTTKQNIDVSQLPAGVYMLEVKNNKAEKAFKRVIKL